MCTLDICTFVSIYGLKSDKSQQIKVGEMLMTMLEFLQNNFRQDLALKIALVAHCLATLWFQGGDAIKVSRTYI